MPLKALDKCNYVIYLSTFSKSISLGLRVKWIVAPERVINKLTLFKQLNNLHVKYVKPVYVMRIFKERLL